MTDSQVASTANPTELLGIGRRHLAVKDYNAAVEALATACEQLAKEHGDTADQCAEAYLWYGKSLLGLSREEAGVLGDGVPGTGNNDEEDDDDDDQEDGEEAQNGEVKNGEVEKGEAAAKENGVVSADSSSTEKPGGSKEKEKKEEEKDGEADVGTSNGEVNDESVANLENEDDVDNLQLAWEMLELSRSILERRVQASGGEAGGAGDAARALLADAHLALGEVALESETYDKAVIDLQSCLDLQKELFRSDDRRIAETHYQIGLANFLASNFEEAITHFKNAANILETRIKTLENPSAAAEDATVKKYSTSDPTFSVEAEIKELKELLPEIQEKIQDMMDYKAETMKRLRETLCPSNGAATSAPSTVTGDSSIIPSFSSSSTASKPVSDISHLIKRKRKASENDEGTAPKRANT